MAARKRPMDLLGARKYSVYKVPMLAKIGGEPFSGPGWIFEIKWDGYRAVAETGGSRVKLYSRNGLSFESKYAEVTTALARIKQKAVLDGEIVVLDAQNKPSFQLLQHYPDINEPHSICYYIFDLLELDGKKLYDLPLVDRKKALKKIIPRDPMLKYCGHVENDGELFFEAVVEKGLEGMMAKRSNSLYLPGRRSNDWLKIRNHNIEEAIICGYTAPSGGRKHFGSLVLGMYEGNRLVYVGRAGTGFDDKSLEELHRKMDRLKRKTSPFAAPLNEHVHITWIRPVLVCNIKYTEWTLERQLRHPVFMGLRMDKKATAVKIKKHEK